MIIELVTKKKPSRREPGRRGPVRSFRFESWGKQDIGSKRARPRWLTERIAATSSELAQRRFKKTKTQVRVGTRRVAEELRSKTDYKNRTNNVFFRLIRALMPVMRSSA